MELEKKILIERLKNLSKQDVLDNDYFGYESEMLFDKDSQQSETMRKKGNKLFAKRDHNKKIHERIWMLYSKSIAFALKDSEELAAAYANRSALLLHLNKVCECLLDIERALKITKSSSLKVKLFCRQSECYGLLHEDKARNSLTKAKHWLKKVDINSDIKKLSETISKTDQVIQKSIPDSKKKDNALKIPYSGDYIDIRFSQTYGKHVVATKDIEPGEFVCAEKFYVTSVNGSKNHACCSHCLAFSWTLIPCDSCSFYMFCSEKCKSEAWEEYHDMECLVKFPYDSSDLIHYYIQLSTKSLIMGIKETGSLKKLKDLVLKTERSANNKRMGYSAKNESNSFEHLINLASSKSEKKLCSCVHEVISVMIRLIENTCILSNRFEINEDLEDLIQNEDIIFIGSILLKLMSICFLNASNTLHLTEACQGKEKYNHCSEYFCCSRGIYISFITRTIRHNCNNNVDKICTNDGRVMYYALQPIRKNDQIRASYCLNFTMCLKVDRQKVLSDVNEFHCDCTACQEDWPIVETMLRGGSTHKYAVFGFEVSMFMDKYKKMDKAMEDPNYKPSKKTFNSFAEDIKILFAKTRQPSPVADCFTYIFFILMGNRYCIKLRVPEECGSVLK